METVFNITCNTDDNYIQHCMAMLCSVFVNNRTSFHVHILTCRLSQKNKEEIQSLCDKYNNMLSVYYVNEEPLEGVQFRKKRPLTKAAYYRLLLSSIISDEIDKILYLDCDMIVKADISPLFSIDLSNYALAATADFMPTNDQHRQQLGFEIDERAFCSGIMMINLKYWRENQSEKDLLAFAKRPREVVYLHDQDVLNHVFRKKWFRLPPKWNRIVFNIIPGGSFTGYKKDDILDYLHNPIVIHYANKVKPWYDMWMPMKNQYMMYLKISGYQNARIEKLEIRKKIVYYMIVLKFLFRFYIVPFIPQLLIIGYNDVCNLIKMLLFPSRVIDRYYIRNIGL